MLDVRIDRKAYVSESGVERTVLSDVRFSVASGEAVGLLGPSGAGKSTMLRILLGLDTAFQGHVRHDFRRVGVVFQEPRLLPWMTVEENIRLVVTDDMQPPDIDFLLQAVQLGHAAGLRPRQLSLGMARRVALARALAISPDLLVLDEPFASLDARLGAGLADSVARWARISGATVIVATHDLAQAMERVSRLLILSGTPARLCADRPVPAAGDTALYAKLLAEFAFLSADQSDTVEARHLPSEQTSG